MNIEDTPYTKVTVILIVPARLHRLLKNATVISDPYVKDGEFYAVDHEGHVHWFEYKGKLTRDMEPLL